MRKDHFIGIDIGTGSARAGVFDGLGNMLSQSIEPIRIWRPKTDYVQQSSEDIWKACCITVKEAVKKANIKPISIAGIGFDATCSLVVIGENDNPVSISPDNDPKQNIIVWMDHRANGEASEINETGHEVLKYVGGVISPEMQTPKLLWLKRNMQEAWKKAQYFFDLPDYLVYKATGVDVRSACTTTCKWTYLSHERSDKKDSIGRWEDTYFKRIGLGDLVEEKYKRIGSIIRPVGESVGKGLTNQAAMDLGLNRGTPVGVSIIDAHAGGLGLLGMNATGSTVFDDRIALIGGTSSCHMAVSKNARFMEGVWGPYYSAMIPDLWLNEGGQSATGALIDHVIFSSSHAESLRETAQNKGCTVYDILNDQLKKMASQMGVGHMSFLTKDLHVLPYFHGNRSPRANPSLTGTISGLKLSSTKEDLALQYLATLQAIAYGTRHIIETMNDHGYKINQIMATGGGTKNENFIHEHAEITGCEVVLPKESEAVLLGSAILGAVAAGKFRSVFEAMINMNQSGRVIKPKDRILKNYHDSKYAVFHKMYENSQAYKQIMEEKTD